MELGAFGLMVDVTLEIWMIFLVGKCIYIYRLDVIDEAIDEANDQCIYRCLIDEAYSILNKGGRKT